ncbi:5-(carboxyamino)imidazole ribonucleotide synthase [Halobacterium jilantaiense]|uniref:N5-carboxyaminoimidazole ribonucleotide synthase n=1 Tax=Halobacterium jilantaiense TaxID=355548 RepID=A0A1I0NG87_9EURY|nr:5-(carboxyamino)imidazole ribonucleotide synthase [Halobacterium jilantaiense]SEW00316.1 5-(carboxyamino)imidazole ribonucleotide synthase [Halobacterium jilantaiense]
MMERVPGATVGVVGGGQLGRMFAEAASPLGVDVVALDPTPDCPAVPPAADQIVADFDDRAAVRDLAERADVLTYEIELADPDALESVAADFDVEVHPTPDTLRTIQDKLVQNRALADAGVPVPDFEAVDGSDDLRAAFDSLGTPLMLKRRTGGYDGRGNAPVASVEAAREEFGDLDGFVAEELVDFERELSVIAVRGDGETATFPVAENVHKAEVLRESVVPARTSESVREQAAAVAEKVLGALDGRGVFGVELFERVSSRDTDGASGDSREREVLVNEIAPRPHNSGHYTIEGCYTSQFEQYARAVLGLPLGDTTLRAPTVMANVLAEPDAETRPAELDGVPGILDEPRLAFHWYGKREVRALRKLGHVTVVGDDRDDLLDRARDARDALFFREGTETASEPAGHSTQS